MRRARPNSAAVAARRSPAAAAFFTRIMARQIRANFHALRVARPGLPDLAAERPLVVYANHPAWWDPALFLVLARRLFARRTSFGPMDAEALSRYAFMRRLGIFGIEPRGYRGAADFLRIASGLLADSKHMLWITAQGDFVDPRARPVRLRPGLARLLARRPDCLAVPLALEYPFWQEKQPEALCRFGAPIAARDLAGDAAAAGQTLEIALAETMDQLAEDAASRDAARFDTLIAGATGVGGFYDLGRRLGAALRGRRFDPAHERDRQA